MKIRNGFVSNSSSSSFCIYGAEFTFDGINSLCTNKGITSSEGMYDLCDQLLAKTDLRHTIDGEGNVVYIGRSWRGIGDDETGKSFKDSIKKELSDIFGEEIECDTCEGEIYC